MRCRIHHVAGAVLAAFSILVAGCGGSSNSGGGGGGGFTEFKRTPVTAQLALPAGSKAEPVAQLRFWTSGGEAAPDASGKGEVVVFNNGPQFAQAYDSQGRMVAAGFLGQNRTNLNMETTAEALAFFAVGGPLQRGKTSARIVLDGVRTMPGYGEVVTAVTDSLNTQGYVTADDPAVKAALALMVEGVLSRSTSRGPDISPTKQVSGLELNDSVDDQVQVTNNHFRRAYAFLEMTGFKDEAGNKVALEKELGESWINVPTRYGGSVDSATGLISGQYSWQPVATDPFKVPAAIAEAEGEVEVYYRLTTVGAGRTGGDFDKMTTAQFVKWEETVFWTAYLDFFVPVFANLIVPLDGDAIDSFTEFALKQDRAKQMISGFRSSMPSVTSLTAQGRFPTAVGGFVSSSQMEPTIVPVTAEIFTAWAETKGRGLFVGQSDIINRVGVATNRIGMINLAAATERMAPLADLERSDLVNVFDITSTRANVSLLPDRTEVSINSTTDITAVIRNKKEGAIYSYEWTVSTPDVFVQDIDGNSTDESPNGVLKSPHEEVFIGNLTTREMTVTVSCRVTLDNKEVGKANTRIQFKNNVEKGTGTFKALGRIIYPQQGSSRYGTWSCALIEVPHVEGAARYSLLVESKTGEDLARASWEAKSPPRRNYDAELWKQKPANADWYVFDGLNTAYISGEEAARAAMERDIATMNSRYTDIRITVTVYLE